MNHSELIARPCPFCGKAADLKNDDTLYPSGIWWRECDGLRSYHGHKDRCEDDFQCWGMHCQETAGGCGASVSGDSATDALEKWNKRPDALQAMERVPMTDAELMDVLTPIGAAWLMDEADECCQINAIRAIAEAAHHGITPPESI